MVAAALVAPLFPGRWRAGTGVVMCVVVAAIAAARPELRRRPRSGRRKGEFRYPALMATMGGAAAGFLIDTALWRLIGRPLALLISLVSIAPVARALFVRIDSARAERDQSAAP